MEELNKINIKLRVGVFFVLALIIMLGVQYIQYRNIIRVEKIQRELINCNKFVLESESIKSAVLFLKNSALTNINSTKYGATSSFKNSNLSIQKKLNFVRQIFVQKKEPTSIISAFSNNAEKSVFADVLIRSLSKIQKKEENKISPLLKESTHFNKKTVRMNYIGDVFVILLIGISGYTFLRHIRRRENIETELLISRQRAEKLMRMEEQFMANMSHEIRTPMNAIIGFTQMLNKTDLNMDQREYVAAVQKSGENLLDIINDILDFSKIEEGKIRMEEISFSLSELLKSTHKMFLTQAKEKNIRLQFHISENLPEFVTGDPTRLNQILINLIGNALKFTLHGSIEVSASFIREEYGKEVIRFSVKDTGIGLPEEKLAEIFDRFTQAKSDTTRKYGGTGLGLSIVKKLVELQGGYMRVKSKEKEGSTFTFVIPYKKSTSLIQDLQTEVEEEIALEVINKTKILVVEDNSLNQKLAGFMLKGWGFQFDIVENGKFALEKLTDNVYDIILMDIQMPELNGYETSRFIRENLKLSLPIIAITAHALPGEKEKCISFGMTDYISKPIKELNLYNKIVKNLNHNFQIENKKNNSHLNINNCNISKKVVNLDYLTELSNGSRCFINEMIHLFLLENPKEIQLLEKSIHEKKYESIKQISHKLKSSISFVGLNKIIGKELKEIETLAENNSKMREIEERFSKVREVCRRAVLELNS